MLKDENIALISTDPHQIERNKNHENIASNNDESIDQDQDHIPPKSGGLFKKNPKNRTFHIPWGSIQEWGCNQADTVY